MHACMALPVPVTRAALLDPEGVYCEKQRKHWRARVALVAERGCRGGISQPEAPGYAVGLKGAIRLLDRYDPVPRGSQGEDSGRPLAVQIILAGPNGHAGTPLQTHGVHLHLDGHNGGS